jgi:SusD/RagB-like outer membrane lipoprotein
MINRPMINRRLYAAGIGTALLVGAAACDTNKLTDVNRNPNSPTDAPSTALFTDAVRSAGVNWLDGVGLPRYDFLSQHLAEVQYPDNDGYLRLRAANTSALFNASYNGELQDLELVTQRGLAANQAGLYGPAMVMKSWEFGTITDTWGDVPYSEAFKAGDLVLSPTYDTQQAIYTDLFTTLAKAATDMGASGAANDLGAADPIYNGELAKWRRFANSLRARHAIRLVYKDPATANTQLTAAFSAAGGLITTNADNAQLKWPGDGVYDNPWATNFKTRDDHRVSDKLIRIVRDNQDPRIAVWAQRATTDEPERPGITLKYCPDATTPCYVGLVNALLHSVASPLIPFTSRPGQIFYPGATAYGTFGGNGAKYQSYMLTAAEVLFIRAEAAERGIGGLTAANAPGFYNAAIQASMEQWGITDAAAIATYLAQPGVSYATAATSADKLKRIAVQKWLALYSQGIQAWAEFRRTCQPSILKAGPEAVVAYVPRRLQYSTTEHAVNSVSVDAAVERQGADNFLSRVWWDTPADASKATYDGTCGQR